MSTVGPHVVKCASRGELGQRAAQAIAAAITAACARHGTARVAFASAPSQTETLTALAAMPGVPWPQVTAFQLDEYVGLSREAPQLFSAWLCAVLFDRVGPGTVEMLDPQAPPQVEAQRYAALLAAPLDVACLGLGVNGHVAFNEPGCADRSDPHAVRVVELDAVSRRQQVDDGCFARIADVPTCAITLTMRTILSAATLVCAVPGAAKAAAVRASLRGAVGNSCPGSLLRDHPDVSFYLDQESAHEL